MIRELAKFWLNFVGSLLNFVGSLLIPFGWISFGIGWYNVRWPFYGEFPSVEFIVVIVAPVLIWNLLWSFVIDKRYLDRCLDCN